MKKIIVCIAAMVALASATPSVNFSQAEWENFKHEHNKVYANKFEEESRMKIFMQNKRKILEHNSKYEKGLISYKLGINKFSDMLHEEFIKKFGGLKHGVSEVLQKKINFTPSIFVASSTTDLPEYVNWNEQGAVTPVKNQGQCNSGYAFASVGALEGQYYKKTGKLIPLSAQQLIDCSHSSGNNGCQSGLITDSYIHIKCNGGIDSEESYQYKGEDDICRFNSSNVVIKNVTYKTIPEKDEESLKAAVATIGPISVTIYAGDALKFYDSGYYYDAECNFKEPNHAALVVGYGKDEEDREFWIVKNSWGEEWGEKGYIKMARNKDNNCFIASLASYPVICDDSSECDV
ncbi:hypothetical protein QAD02_008935 [Eretmocerus hayati]|uniref:Uncharacterized protein n=1 Tax=Eretmocerus hayati TaxID=131215 RepID=A0ACC2N8M0_9HYME|nr:hypothetical protein QAD02_008935 [Eretmocerus hayati]